MLAHLNGLNTKQMYNAKIKPRFAIHQILPPSHFNNLSAMERKAIENVMNTPPSQVSKLSAGAKEFYAKVHPEAHINGSAELGFSFKNIVSKVKATVHDAGASIKATEKAAVKNIATTTEAAGRSVAVTVKKAAANFTPAAIKSFAKDLTKGGILGTFKRVAAAPMRAAFLLLVDANMLKLATNLADSYRKNPAKVKDFWEKVGGDINILKRSINLGAKTVLNGSMGVVVAASLTAAMATATPIIIAATALIKSLIPEHKPSPEEQNAIDVAAAEFKAQNGVETITNPDGTTTNINEPFYKNPYIMIPAAALLVGGGYLLLKKK